MKKIYFFRLLICSFLFLSCSDTNVVENWPDESAYEPPYSGYFKKRVLIEDYTGTWCGNCTRVSHAIEEVKLLTDKAVTVAIDYYYRYYYYYYYYYYCYCYC